MNKFSMLISAICIAGLLLCGCSAEDDVSTSSESTAETATTTTTAAEEVTEPPITERELEPAEGTYVYDNAGILDSASLSECNDYCEWLYENYLINAAVVTTADLGELSPEEYAANAYIDIYEGKGSGLLLLINNDTNKDYLYKTGSCLNSIDEETEKEAFYWATREIVSGDCKTAVLRMMQLGEMCSQYVFDNAGVFSSEEADVLEKACNEASADISVLATTNSTGTPNLDICRTYYERRYQDKQGYMIMLDTASGTITVVTGSEAISGYDSELESADKLAASGNYTGAVSAMIAALKG